MSVDGLFVIDSVTHAFDSRASNAIGRYGRAVLEGNFRFQWTMTPDPYRLPAARYFQTTTADALESALFLESDVDVAFYHTIPAWGFFHDLSPMSVGLELRRRHPNRIFLYGGVSPVQAQALDELDRQVEEWGIRGLKLYPVDIIDGELRVISLADDALTYPILERCQRLGVGVIAIHKAFPLGPIQMDPFRSGDVDYAARDFPSLRFEIVHGGFAFLDETAFQVARFDNVYINLESTSALIVRHPRKFAKILGELLMWGGAKKIFWATGASSPHPHPILEAFRTFEMPRDMVEGDGYPEITPEIRADILANNFAAVHDLDLGTLAHAIADDDLARRRGETRSAPWSLVGTPQSPDPLALQTEAAP